MDRGHAWGICAVALGVWETVAWTTRRLPTVSDTVESARKKRRRATLAGLAAWLVGLGWHLATYERVRSRR